jgi:hypothetical protein
MDEKLYMIQIINMLMDEINSNKIILSDSTREFISKFLKERKAVKYG